MIWFKMLRPATLPAAIVPVVIGIAIAAQTEPLAWSTAVVTLCTATLIQILSNLVNDLYDYKRGADGKERLGPVRAISAGLITENYLKRWIYAVVAVTLLGGAYLIYIGGWPIILIGLSALLFAWLYSATSKSLSALGIADLFVLIYFGPIAAAGTYYLQCGTLSTLAIVCGIGSGLISMAILTVNNLRDIHQDRSQGKRTLIVRLGETFAKGYYFTLILLPAIAFLLIESPYYGIPYLIALFLLFSRFLNATGRGYNKILLFTALLNLLYGALLTVALL